MPRGRALIKCEPVFVKRGLGGSYARRAGALRVASRRGARRLEGVAPQGWRETLPC
ncbi:MAG: hypothetical protein JWP44_4857 [Mucilaginibacter sp.]|nr:hypothetical protein [Mucilaginibacter sp.]